MSLFQFIGFIGVFLYLLSYLLLSLKKIDGNGANYIILNLIAAVAVSLSLIEQFNAPSLVIQSTWILLSIIALFKIFYQKQKAKNIQKSIDF